MSLTIRKTMLHVETLLTEGGRDAPRPIRMVAAAAIVSNPWAGQGYVENLRPEILEAAPILGKLLTGMVMDAIGGGEVVEAYGKAAVVGLNGELEHANALIHTLHFGNFFRDAVGAKSYLSFTNTRGAANAPIMIPMMDKNDAGRRSHYLTYQFSIPDAPMADEIVIALGASDGGRPHHRIGDRYQDLKDLGRDHENPAGI